MKLSRWITAATAAVASALMPACDIVNLNEIRPGITTAAEVRARMGEPGFIHHDNDGTAIWEYSRQPQGVHCYMIAFDRKDVVTRMDQVLNDANYARIADGLSKDDVRRILGAPATKVVFDNLREEVWEWRIEGTPHNEVTFFNVHFDTGTGLVKKAGKRVEMKG